jgi:hypothetical protein
MLNAAANAASWTVKLRNAAELRLKRRGLKMHLYHGYVR